MRRTIKVAAVVGAGALMLTACGSGGGGSGDASLKTRGNITIWYSNNEAEIAWGKQMVAAWNADHPKEQVKAQEIPAGDSSEAVISAAITAGNAPCLIFNTSPAAVPQFEKAGGLVALSSFPDGDSYIKARSGDNATQYKSADGKFYQLPWKSNPVMIFYNKAMFTKAGLDPNAPKLSTYDDFLATSRTLTKSGAAKYAIYPAPSSEFYQPWFDFYPLYAAETGGKLLVENNKATFDSTEGKAVSEFWATIYKEKLAGQETYKGDSFVDGLAAMRIAGPWAITFFGKSVDWGTVPVPTSAGTSPDKTFTFSDAKNVGLFTACKAKGTAWDVLKFATSEKQDGQLLTLTGQMPLRQDLTKVYPDYFTANPAYKVFGDQANRVVEVPNVANSVEIWQTFRDAYSPAVIFGQGSVDTFLKDTAAKVDTLAGQK
ncbi:extracellular solute-binding protein [Microbacterium deminutum]|uniref:Extracellular solute-binding protein n=1 Tax=Microbacterium deminutum TaxID=344164 RepID=A0ABN2Q674_9MICO